MNNRGLEPPLHKTESIDSKVGVDHPHNNMSLATEFARVAQTCLIHVGTDTSWRIRNAETGPDVKGEKRISSPACRNCLFSNHHPETGLQSEACNKIHQYGGGCCIAEQTAWRKLH